MSRYCQAFETMRDESKLFNEHRDCTVKALTITTGEDYATCHAAMKAQGRKNRKGSSVMAMEKAAKRLGYDMTAVDRRSYHAKTMRTVERDRAFQSGNYIVAVARHVAAVVDGKVVDWSEGRLNRVQEVYCVTPTEGYLPAWQAPTTPITVPAHQWAPVPQQMSLI